MERGRKGCGRGRTFDDVTPSEDVEQDAEGAPDAQCWRVSGARDREQPNTFTRMMYVGINIEEAIGNSAQAHEETFGGNSGNGYSLHFGQRVQEPSAGETTA